MFHEETSRHLHDLTSYTSGYIHWAFGTASVDQHGMPSSYKLPSPPSKTGTAILLDREMLEAILVSQKADQNWIDTLSMLRRVHSTWNHVVRSICPELSPAVPRTPNQEQKETWLSTFHREQGGVKDRIRERRQGPQPAFTYAARYIFNIIRSYPTNLDILIEAMISLSLSIPPITDEVLHDTEFFTGNSHQNVLYSILSRHVLRSRLYMLYYKCGGENLSLYVHVIVCHYTYTVCLYIYIQSTSRTCRASLLVILIRMTKTWLQPVMNSPDKVSSKGVRLAAETAIPTTLSPNPKLNALNFSSPGYPRAFGIKATNSRRSTG